MASMRRQAQAVSFAAIALGWQLVLLWGMASSVTIAVRMDVAPRRESVLPPAPAGDDDFDDNNTLHADSPSVPTPGGGNCTLQFENEFRSSETSAPSTAAVPASRVQLPPGTANETESTSTALALSYEAYARRVVGPAMVAGAALLWILRVMFMV